MIANQIVAEFPYYWRLTKPKFVKLCPGYIDRAGWVRTKIVPFWHSFFFFFFPVKEVHTLSRTYGIHPLVLTAETWQHLRHLTQQGKKDSQCYAILLIIPSAAVRRILTGRLTVWYRKSSSKDEPAPLENTAISWVYFTGWGQTAEISDGIVTTQDDQASTHRFSHKFKAQFLIFKQK